MAEESRTYVLIPGAGGSASYWYRVVAEMSRRGLRSVAVELPADDDSAGLPEYADAVVEAIGGSGEAGSVILVAQSMAGFTTPLVWDRVPTSMVVLVNAMIPNPGETPGEWWANTGQAEAMRDKDARDGRPVGADFDPDTYFLHDLPPDVIEESGKDLKPQSDTVFGSPCRFDSWPDLPIRVLIGSDDRFFPAEFQHRIARERLGIDGTELPGGHLVALARPAELVDHLEACRASAEQVPSPTELGS